MNIFEQWQEFYDSLPHDENNEYILTEEQEEQAGLLTAQLLYSVPEEEERV